LFKLNYTPPHKNKSHKYDAYTDCLVKLEIECLVQKSLFAQIETGPLEYRAWLKFSCMFVELSVESKFYRDPYLYIFIHFNYTKKALCKYLYRSFLNTDISRFSVPAKFTLQIQIRILAYKKETIFMTPLTSICVLETI